VTFRVEPLGDHHQLDNFDCGNPELNQWLQLHARHATAQGTRTYVLIDDAGEEIAGYFALAPHLIERQEIPPRVGRGSPRHIPAILLAKLALDRSHHGQGLGAELLVRGLQTTLTAARTAGGKVVVVDAIDGGAAQFYEHHNFVPLPGNPHRLVQKLSTIAKALREPWP
jgi:GNAT superfamily N-acetyltransferase